MLDLQSPTIVLNRFRLQPPESQTSNYQIPAAISVSDSEKLAFVSIFPSRLHRGPQLLFQLLICTWYSYGKLSRAIDVFGVVVDNDGVDVVFDSII
jgi:hypothetical protein